MIYLLPVFLVLIHSFIFFGLAFYIDFFVNIKRFKKTFKDKLLKVACLNIAC